MKYLSVEKRKDGTVEVTSYINSDGSPTYKTYANMQEAINAVPILAKESTGLDKDSDRADVYFASDGKIDRVESHVFSTSIDEETKKTLSISDSAKTSVVALANEILMEEGKPKLGESPIDPIENAGEVGGVNP